MHSCSDGLQPATTAHPGPSCLTLYPAASSAASIYPLLLCSIRLYCLCRRLYCLCLLLYCLYLLLLCCPCYPPPLLPPSLLPLHPPPLLYLPPPPLLYLPPPLLPLPPPRPLLARWLRHHRRAAHLSIACAAGRSDMHGELAGRRAPVDSRSTQQQNGPDDPPAPQLQQQNGPPAQISSR